MSRLERVLAMTAVALLLGVLGALLGERMGSAPPREAAEPSPPADQQSVAMAAAADEVMTGSSALPAPVRDPAAVAAHIARDSVGTYLGDILRARGAQLARWPERRSDPVRVWVDERATAPGFDRGFVDAVRRAFDEWGRAGLPLRFVHRSDSAGAEVRVVFRERFPEGISGRTRWVRDPNGWILGGDIELALRTPRDLPVTSEQLQAIALHEIGHLLGLDHARDSTTIMSPRVYVLQLAPADVATLRLLYALPPGPVQGP
jgi:hypothetical protein